MDELLKPIAVYKGCDELGEKYYQVSIGSRKFNHPWKLRFLKRKFPTKGQAERYGDLVVARLKKRFTVLSKKGRKFS